MVVHEVRVHPSAARLPREAQLTWKIAELAAAAPPPEADVADEPTGPRPSTCGAGCAL